MINSNADLTSAYFSFLNVWVIHLAQKNGFNYHFKQLLITVTETQYLIPTSE